MSCQGTAYFIAGLSGLSVGYILRVLLVLFVFQAAVSATIAGADTCKGDFDIDGDVDCFDLTEFLTRFGRMDLNAGCNGDFNHDGDVDGLDLAIFAGSFGQTGCNLPEPEVTLSADPQSITFGESCTLSWISVNAVSAFLDHGIGDVLTNGSLVVTPSETKTYTLTVNGGGGTAADTATVNVQNLIPGCSESGGDFPIIIDTPFNGSVIGVCQTSCRLN